MVRCGRVVGCRVSRCTATTVPPLQQRRGARLQKFPSVRAAFAEHTGQARLAQPYCQQFHLVRGANEVKAPGGAGAMSLW